MQRISKVKSQKGSISLFVLLALLFFLAVVTSVGTSFRNKEASIDANFNKIKAKYEKEFDEYIHDTYRGKIRFDNIRILKTWQPVRRGFLNLEIKLDGDMITPALTFVASMEGKKEVIFESATYLLFGENRLTRKTWRITAEDAFQIRIEKAHENDRRVDVIFPAYGAVQEESFVVEENFHLREFLAPLDALVPQSKTVHDFVGGAMLQIN